LIVTVKVDVFEAQSPAFGLNVYSVVWDVFTAGDQEPGMASKEAAGRLKLVPAQTGEIVLKVGVTIGLTVTDNVCVEAHAVATGVNV